MDIYSFSHKLVSGHTLVVTRDSTILIANNCDFVVADMKAKSAEIMVASNIPQPIVSGHIDGIILLHYDLV
jgi:hypothetical protein